MPLLSYAEINLANILHNINEIKRVSGCKHIIAPMKANAYGHGLVPVSKFLEKKGIEHLAVAFSSEGRILRENGIKIPILILSAIEEMNDIIKYQLIPTIYSIEFLRELKKLAKANHCRIPVHIDIDTGMGRTGIFPHETEKIFSELTEGNHLELKGLYTHLSSSDNKADPFTQKQIELFTITLGKLLSRGAHPTYIHCANSGGILNFPGTGRGPFNALRPGIMLYGCSPDNKPQKKLTLKPALSLKSQIFYLKTVKKNTAIGYNHTYRTRTTETIATVAIGYGDGFHRHLSNKGRCLVNGQWAPIVGRISMDQTTIKLPNKNFAKPGDLATFIGQDSKKKITVEEMAIELQTIPYEIFCHLNERVTRVYKNG